MIPVKTRCLHVRHRSLTVAALKAAAFCGAALAIIASAAAQGGPKEEAGRILQAAGVKGGLIVHLGCGDGRLTAALRTDERLLVHGLDADPAAVQKARAHVRSLALYGPVSVEEWAGGRLPYADNLVNLLVAEELGAVPMEEAMRVLAPHGTALVGGKKTVKPWPADIDEWTHWLHDASGNAVARDRVVGPPARIQWVDGPLWQRHHEMNANPSALVSAHGRIFYICDEAPATVSGLPDRWSLVARDAFNGVLLWKRPLADWGWKAWSTAETGGRFNQPLHIHERLVAAGDRLYATLGFNAPLSALDAATGEVVRTYEATRGADEVLHHEGVLIVSVNQAPQGPGRIADSPPPRKRIVAIKADTGQVLWSQGDFAGVSSKSGVFERITHLWMAAGAGKVVFMEEDAVVALDLATGRQLWRAPRPEKKMKQGHIPYNPPNLCTLVVYQDVVLFAQPEEPYTRETWNRPVRCLLTGLAGDTGRVLWSQPCGKWGPGVAADVFVIGGLVWTHAAEDMAAVAIDPHSGQVKRSFSTRGVFDEEHHHRCFRNKATEQYLLTGRRGIEFIDLGREETGKNHWVRGACRYGVMPANGLVYAPPHPCQCYIDVKINGFYALAAAGRAAPARRGDAAASPAAARDADRLRRGPAWGQGASVPARLIESHDDWPTYRHDARRSGSTPAQVPLEAGRLSRLWETPLGGQAGACTAAGGKIFAACPDQNRVCALDADDGHILWEFTAGGRVDTPPTIHQGLALFGSADGAVYCVRAGDGALFWRRRIAPDERRIVAFGRVESAWPVHGTVLVDGGAAYAAAGRSTHLDGGIEVQAINPLTGDLIRTLSPLNRDPHGLEDVLVADGGTVFMRHLAYSMREGAAAPAAPDAAPDVTASAPPAAKSAAKAGAKPATKQAANLDASPAAKPAAKQAQRQAAQSRAFSTAGLLDDSCFSRVGWAGAGGGKGPADLLVFDEECTYALRTQRKGGFGGWFKPATDAYELAAVDRKTAKARWSKTLPIRIRAMAAAGRTLFVAGSPDEADPRDPWAAFDGRKGGILLALSVADGSTLAECRLDTPPAWDGMAVAGGRLYLSLTSGRVACFGGR